MNGFVSVLHKLALLLLSAYFAGTSCGILFNFKMSIVATLCKVELRLLLNLGSITRSCCWYGFGQASSVWRMNGMTRKVEHRHGAVEVPCTTPVDRQRLLISSPLWLPSDGSSDSSLDKHDLRILLAAFSFKPQQSGIQRPASSVPVSYGSHVSLTRKCSSSRVLVHAGSLIPLTSASPSSLITQSFTPPFQSLIRPSRILTTTTLTS